jgi:hypothetical protein
MVLTLLRDLPGVHDLLVTVACETSHRLNTSPGASGPHDFAVRFHIARLAILFASIAFHPAFVAIASRPSFGMERRMIDVICDFCQAEIL